MPSNGGEVSSWLDRSAHIALCVKMCKNLEIERSTYKAAHAHLHGVPRTIKFRELTRFILVQMLNIVGGRERPNLGFARDVRAA